MTSRDLVSITDLSADAAWEIFHLARETKEKLRKGIETPYLKGKTMALLFEKPSLRTRCTFEVGMYQLGGYCIYLAPSDIGLGTRESVYDIAKNIERWVDIAVARTFLHSTIADLARYAERIPVINALSDVEHPCQAMTDYFTIWEKQGSLDKVRVAFIGDGNNTCNSLLLLAALLGAKLTIASPRGFEPPDEIIKKAETLAGKSGAEVSIINDPVGAVKNADFVYTDVWASMGQESEAEHRRRIFSPFQVNAALLKHAPKTAFIMHDLPAHRGEEITDEVIDSPRSIVFDQAENRLHAQKGILIFLSCHSQS